jgi:ElaB/YqjD/DUF883 family membrane-anchored ribosome-binding protein
MNWNDVGEWLKANAGTGAALVGSLLTGNVPGAVAAGVAMVSSATGTTDPATALQSLQNSPETVLRLRELAVQEADSIRQHIRAMEEARLADEQAAHHEQQETIRHGDSATDEYVRRTRPMMARQSWYAAAGYVIAFEAAKAAGWINAGPVVELALLLMGPAGAYIGFRSFDRWKGGIK